ncbi:MAG TPA: ATP-binding protein [Candidatus Deferrimicrobium sp.]|nr:ATP-binding protein [Candidatus Deferrimicrobium sp.]
MPNPFFYGGRIEKTDNFVGRRAELRIIFSALDTFAEGQAQHISIVGERRIGKSSLLYHVTQVYNEYLRFPHHYRFVFVDLDNTHTHTLSGLLTFILKQLELPFSKQVSLVRFNDIIETFHEKSRMQSVLCLDEFEHLANRKEEFPNIVYETFRSLGSNNKIAYITASKAPLFDLIHQSNMTSTFPNIFTQLLLGEFTESEVNELVQRGKFCDHPFTGTEIKYMRLFGGKHPYRLQVAGEKIYSQKTSSDPIDWKKVKNSIDKQIKQSGIERHNNWYDTIKRTITSFLMSLGRAVLETRKSKNDISDSTALWWGVITIVIALLILFGLLPLGWLCSAPLKLDAGQKQDKLCSRRSARCPGQEEILGRSSKQR